MEWNALLQNEEIQECTIQIEEKTSLKFYNLHTGNYKITYAPLTGTYPYFIVEPSILPESRHKPWHVTLQLFVEMIEDDDFWPESMRWKVYTLKFSNKTSTYTPSLEWFHKCHLGGSMINRKSYVRTRFMLREISDEGLLNCSLLVQRASKYIPTTDLMLIVDDKRIPVRKDFMIENSSVFKEMLTRESRELKIELKDVDVHQFILFLAVMHDFVRPNIDHVVLDFLFRLSYNYQVSLVKDKCLEYINHLEHHDLAAFLLLADNYDDATVVLAAIESIKSQQQHYGVMTSHEFKLLKLETRKRILMKETSKQRSNEVLSTSKQKKVQVQVVLWMTYVTCLLINLCFYFIISHLLKY